MSDSNIPTDNQGGDQATEIYLGIYLNVGYDDTNAMNVDPHTLESHVLPSLVCHLQQMVRNLDNYLDQKDEHAAKADIFTEQVMEQNRTMSLCLAKTHKSMMDYATDIEKECSTYQVSCSKSKEKCQELKRYVLSLVEEVDTLDELSERRRRTYFQVVDKLCYNSEILWEIIGVINQIKKRRKEWEKDKRGLVKYFRDALDLFDKDLGWDESLPGDLRSFLDDFISSAEDCMYSDDLHSGLAGRVNRAARSNGMFDQKAWDRIEEIVRSTKETPEVPKYVERVQSVCNTEGLLTDLLDMVALRKTLLGDESPTIAQISNDRQVLDKGTYFEGSHGMQEEPCPTENGCRVAFTTLDEALTDCCSLATHEVKKVNYVNSNTDRRHATGSTTGRNPNANSGSLQKGNEKVCEEATATDRVDRVKIHDSSDNIHIRRGEFADVGSKAETKVSSSQAPNGNVTSTHENSSDVSGEVAHVTKENPNVDDNHTIADDPNVSGILNSVENGVKPRTDTEEYASQQESYRGQSPVSSKNKRQEDRLSDDSLESIEEFPRHCPEENNSVGPSNAYSKKMEDERYSIEDFQKVAPNIPKEKEAASVDQVGMSPKDVKTTSVAPIVKSPEYEDGDCLSDSKCNKRRAEVGCAQNATGGVTNANKISQRVTGVGSVWSTPKADGKVSQKIVEAEGNSLNALLGDESIEPIDESFDQDSLIEPTSKSPVKNSTPEFVEGGTSQDNQDMMETMAGSLTIDENGHSPSVIYDLRRTGKKVVEATSGANETNDSAHCTEKSDTLCERSERNLDDKPPIYSHKQDKDNKITADKPTNDDPHTQGSVSETILTTVKDMFPSGESMSSTSCQSFPKVTTMTSTSSSSRISLASSNSSLTVLRFDNPQACAPPGAYLGPAATRDIYPSGCHSNGAESDRGQTQKGKEARRSRSPIKNRSGDSDVMRRASPFTSAVLQRYGQRNGSGSGSFQSNDSSDSFHGISRKENETMPRCEYKSVSAEPHTPVKTCESRSSLSVTSETAKLWDTERKPESLSRISSCPTSDMNLSLESLGSSTTLSKEPFSCNIAMERNGTNGSKGALAPKPSPSRDKINSTFSVSTNDDSSLELPIIQTPEETTQAAQSKMKSSSTSSPLLHQQEKELSHQDDIDIEIMVGQTHQDNVRISPWLDECSEIASPVTFQKDLVETSTPEDNRCSVSRVQAETKDSSDESHTARKPKGQLALGEVRDCGVSSSEKPDHEIKGEVKTVACAQSTDVKSDPQVERTPESEDVEARDETFTVAKKTADKAGTETKVSFQIKKKASTTRKKKAKEDFSGEKHDTTEISDKDKKDEVVVKGVPIKKKSDKKHDAPARKNSIDKSSSLTAKKGMNNKSNQGEIYSPRTRHIPPKPMTTPQSAKRVNRRLSEIKDAKKVLPELSRTPRKKDNAKQPLKNVLAEGHGNSTESETSSVSHGDYLNHSANAASTEAPIDKGHEKAGNDKVGSKGKNTTEKQVMSSVHINQQIILLPGDKDTRKSDTVNRVKGTKSDMVQNTEKGRQASKRTKEQKNNATNEKQYVVKVKNTSVIVKNEKVTVPKTSSKGVYAESQFKVPTGELSDDGKSRTFGRACEKGAGRVIKNSDEELAKAHRSVPERLGDGVGSQQQTTEKGTKNGRCRKTKTGVDRKIVENVSGGDTCTLKVNKVGPNMGRSSNVLIVHDVEDARCKGTLEEIETEIGGCVNLKENKRNSLICLPKDIMVQQAEKCQINDKQIKEDGKTQAESRQCKALDGQQYKADNDQCPKAIGHPHENMPRQMVGTGQSHGRKRHQKEGAGKSDNRKQLQTKEDIQLHSGKEDVKTSVCFERKDDVKLLDDSCGLKPKSWVDGDIINKDTNELEERRHHVHKENDKSKSKFKNIQTSIGRAPSTDEVVTATTCKNTQSPQQKMKSVSSASKIDVSSENSTTRMKFKRSSDKNILSSVSDAKPVCKKKLPNTLDKSEADVKLRSRRNAFPCIPTAPSSHIDGRKSRLSTTRASSRHSFGASETPRHVDAIMASKRRSSDNYSLFKGGKTDDHFNSSLLNLPKLNTPGQLQKLQEGTQARSNTPENATPKGRQGPSCPKKRISLPQISKPKETTEAVTPRFRYQKSSLSKLPNIAPPLPNMQDFESKD